MTDTTSAGVAPGIRLSRRIPRRSGTPASLGTASSYGRSEPAAALRRVIEGLGRVAFVRQACDTFQHIVILGSVLLPEAIHSQVGVIGELAARNLPSVSDVIGPVIHVIHVELTDRANTE